MSSCRGVEVEASTINGSGGVTWLLANGDSVLVQDLGDLSPV